ncbi:hypothetical protein RA19_12565 [Leisingera sp. ANG-M1]|uniref:hypothetical protein n=1 Tax=Leisingera sp. ANG-M1 TaxID=1577895 RepID=UPI00057F28CC|nr:hypothetical protein [Leisingera sp. ANG-M1]KIC09996.1 hypothetical protein RA19_12565 [Leisingera sp. ANG-M1]
MQQEDKELPAWLSLLILLWPLALWVAGFIISQAAQTGGCKIWAKGPEECIFLGTNIGELIYPLWSLGFYLPFVLLWVPCGLIILGIIRFALRNAR